jgi:hypothetical protein
MPRPAAAMMVKPMLTPPSMGSIPVRAKLPQLVLTRLALGRTRRAARQVPAVPVSDELCPADEAESGFLRRDDAELAAVAVDLADGHADDAGRFGDGGGVQDFELFVGEWHWLLIRLPDVRADALAQESGGCTKTSARRDS